ncbi:Uncharacterised protein [Mycobacterium tuberculosis]|nr:Uncharacterised protein [Mycobacterium tuberculosis]
MNQPDLEHTDVPVCPHCGDEWDTPWEIMDDDMGEWNTNAESAAGPW